MSLYNIDTANAAWGVLTSLFYELARDHMTVGGVNRVLSNLKEEGVKEVKFTDKELEMWATAKAKVVLNLMRAREQVALEAEEKEG